MTVQRSKGHSRILAIRDDLAAELRQYNRHRETVLAASGASDPVTLFIRRDGSALTLRAASDALRGLLRDLGLKPPLGRQALRVPACLRDAPADRLRHRRCRRAREAAVVVGLPRHQNVLGTEVYLKATPQLLQLALSSMQQRREEAHARNFGDGFAGRYPAHLLREPESDRANVGLSAPIQY